MHIGADGGVSTAEQPDEREDEGVSHRVLQTRSVTGDPERNEASPIMTSHHSPSLPVKAGHANSTLPSDCPSSVNLFQYPSEMSSRRGRNTRCMEAGSREMWKRFWIKPREQGQAQPVLRTLP